MPTKYLFRHPKRKFFTCKSRLLGICIFVAFFSFSSIKSQTVIYAQPFSGTLAASGWASVSLTAPWGNATLFGISNIWKVNDLESGLSANTCGAGSMGDPSLYMGATAFASGAAYLSDVNTNRRVASPDINTTGYTNVILDFDYMGNGEGTTDKAYLVYSVNGGSTWVAPTGAPTSVNPAMGAGGDLNNLKSQICGSGQGLWTHLTWSMPVSCEGITTFKVGFVWQSNNNSSGSDPSFAVDDVTISGTLTPAPIELLSFTANYNGKNAVDLNWITASEINNDFFTIERSREGYDFSQLFILDGAGNSSSILQYNTVDENPLNGHSYYRLKQTDYNGDYKYSNVVDVNIVKTDFEISSCYNSQEQGQLEITINSFENASIFIELFSSEGKKVFSSKVISTGNDFKLVISSYSMSKGVYLLKATAGGQLVTRKLGL